MSPIISDVSLLMTIHDSNPVGADIGYGIIIEERRQGYAEEAARALIKWAFSNVTLNVITAKCLIANNSSVHLLKKLDFKEIKKDEEMLFWSISRTNTLF